MVEFLGIWERVHNPGFNYGEFAVVKSQTGQSTAPPHQFLSWALPDDRFLAVVAVLAPAAVSSTPDGGCCVAPCFWKPLEPPSRHNAACWESGNAIR
jgi:hypothetical protein